MRGVVLHGPGDVRVEDREGPRVVEPTDAVLRVTAACVCGSDLWPYRGLEELPSPAPMGHEYVGVVEQVGDDVSDVAVGDLVVGSFWASDNTCEICRAGYQSGRRSPARSARRTSSRSGATPASPASRS
jgi:threonine dehydrogenase-like Zn-dependent dehydrogenase